MFIAFFLVLIVVYIIMVWMLNKNVQIKMIKIITDDQPLELITINNTPIFDTFDLKIREDVQKAWMQYLNHTDRDNKTF